jgi:hypothetical protein
MCRDHILSALSIIGTAAPDVRLKGGDHRHPSNLRTLVQIIKRACQPTRNTTTTTHRLPLIVAGETGEPAKSAQR